MLQNPLSSAEIRFAPRPSADALMDSTHYSRRETFGSEFLVSAVT